MLEEDIQEDIQEDGTGASRFIGAGARPQARRTAATTKSPRPSIGGTDGTLRLRDRRDR